MNTARMSWRASPRKIARWEAEEARRRAAERAAEAQVIYLWGDEYNLLALHPCATQQMGLQPKATCARCRRAEDVSLPTLLRTKYAHRPWAEVMPVLRCSTCRSPPAEVVFARTAMANPAAYCGRLSIHPPPEEERPPVTWAEEAVDTRWRRTL